MQSLAEAAADPRDTWGVRQPTRLEVAGQVFDRPLLRFPFRGVTYEILRHPSLLVPETIQEWLQDYQYTQEYKVPIPYAQRHPVWVELANMYREVVAECRIRYGKN